MDYQKEQVVKQQVIREVQEDSQKMLQGCLEIAECIEGRLVGSAVRPEEKCLPNEPTVESQALSIRSKLCQLGELLAGIRDRI